MALFDRPRDPRFDIDDPNYVDRSSSGYGGNLLPLILAAAIALAIIAVVYQGFGSRIGDTNTGPAVEMVAPTPSPSTSPVVPTPSPTTEPRPTQAPIR